MSDPKKVVAGKKEELVEIILVKGMFKHNGVTYKKGPVPFKVPVSVANTLIKNRVAVVPKPKE